MLCRKNLVINHNMFNFFVPEFEVNRITAEANDYSISPENEVTFEASDGSEPITLTVTDDSEVEGDEILTLTLNDPEGDGCVNGNLGENHQLNVRIVDNDGKDVQKQMLLIPNALCCSLYKRNCVCAVTKFLPAKKKKTFANFCEHKKNNIIHGRCSCTFVMINRGLLELATSPIKQNTDSSILFLTAIVTFELYPSL